MNRYGWVVMILLVGCTGQPEGQVRVAGVDGQECIGGPAECAAKLATSSLQEQAPETDVTNLTCPFDRVSTKCKNGAECCGTPKDCGEFCREQETRPTPGRPCGHGPTGGGAGCSGEQDPRPNPTL